MNLRERKVIHVLDGGYRLAINCHVFKGRLVKRLVPIPVHGKD